MTDCICGGHRGYYDDPDEPRERFCTCAAAFRVRKMDDFSSVPPRTVFVHPVTFHRIAQRYAGPVESLLHVTLEWRPTPHIEVATAGGSWSILGGPDCPIDYAWPESAPPEVAEVVRQGIADARKGGEHEPR